MVDPTKTPENVGEQLSEAIEEDENSYRPLSETLGEVAGDIFMKIIQEQKEKIGDRFTGDRARGIVSPEDRMFLWEQHDYDYDQSEYKAKDRIRERIENSILDYTDIECNLEEDERARIFEEYPGNLEDDLVMPLRFFYRGLNCDANTFETIVEQAVYEAEREQRNSQNSSELVTVDVSIDIDRSANLEALETKFREGEPLSDRERGALLRSGKLDTDQIEELANKSREETLAQILRNRFSEVNNSSNSD